MLNLQIAYKAGLSYLDTANLLHETIAKSLKECNEYYVASYDMVKVFDSV